MRHFRMRRVTQVLDSERIADHTWRNSVIAECGHRIDVFYWPYGHHYRVGMRVRCYECGRAPTNQLRRKRNRYAVRDDLEALPAKACRVNPLRQMTE